MREQIIAEIKRLARAAGGQPPGRSTFGRETGIPESAWRGVYWARWGDALLEAGYSPNQFNPKLDRDVLFNKLTRAFRHFGKTPTDTELRMYGKIDPDFPSHSTISSRYPTKRELLAAFREWISDQAGFADVARLLPTSLPEPDVPFTSDPEGWVYLFQWGKHYKIGRSDDVEKRVNEIGIKLPDKLTIVHRIKTDDPPGIEAYWHKRFENKRVNGEWFKLSGADVAAFRRRKYQ